MDIAYILNIRLKKMIVFVLVIVYKNFFLTKVLGIDFKSAVLNLHYPRFS